MKMGSRMEPVEHAFMGGLAGFAAFVILDVGWFVMNHGAAPRSIASQLLGMPILAFGSACLFTLDAMFLNWLRSVPAPVRIRRANESCGIFR